VHGQLKELPQEVKRIKRVTMDCQVLVLVAKTFEQFADNEYETIIKDEVIRGRYAAHRA